MISTEKIIDQVFAELSGSDIRSELSGGIYKYQRPLNSKKEDVVLSYSGGMLSQFQTDIVKCNVYIPNLKDGRVDSARIGFFSDKITSFFDKKTYATYRYELVENPKIFKVQDIEEYMLNVMIRVTINTTVIN